MVKNKITLGMLALTAAFALAVTACDTNGDTDGPGGFGNPSDLPPGFWGLVELNRNAPSAEALAAGGFANVAEFNALVSAAGGGFQGWLFDPEFGDLFMYWTGRNFSHFNSVADALAARPGFEETRRGDTTNWATSSETNALGRSANLIYELDIFGPVESEWGAGFMILWLYPPHL